MNKILLRWLVPSIILLALIVIFGEDSGELGDMAVVVGLAVADDRQGLELTIEVASLPNGSGPGESQVFSAGGRDWNDCVVQLRESLDHHLFWSNCLLLLVEENFPHEEELLSWLYQEKVLSSEVVVAAYSGNGAQILETGFGKSEFTSAGIVGSLEQQAGNALLTLADYLRDEDNNWPWVRLENEEVVAIYE